MERSGMWTVPVTESTQSGTHNHPQTLSRKLKHSQADKTQSRHANLLTAQIPKGLEKQCNTPSQTDKDKFPTQSRLQTEKKEQ